MTTDIAPDKALVMSVLSTVGAVDPLEECLGPVAIASGSPKKSATPSTATRQEQALQDETIGLPCCSYKKGRCLTDKFCDCWHLRSAYFTKKGSTQSRREVSLRPSQ